MKVILSSLTLISLLAGLYLYGFFLAPGPVNIISPKIEAADPFEQVQLKLEVKPSDINIPDNKTLIKEAQAEGEFNEASSYIVVDADTGEMIAGKSTDTALPVASLTKIMTATVALDLADPKESFLISETAPKVEPTNMGLIPGQRWTIEELLHGMLMTSSNDCAQAVKEGIDLKYGDGTFIRAMNAKAKFLGLNNSSFDNPQGFDGEKNYSTAKDLAKLSLYIYKNYPLISEIVKKDYQFFPETSNHKQADLINWNGLLGTYPGVYGLKIGNTEKANKTTIVAANRQGHKILSVLLGAPGIKERDLWASELLDLGFAKKFDLDPVNINTKQLAQKYADWNEKLSSYK